MAAKRSYWLFKSEPDVFSIQHLESRPGKTESWDGVRNYQARNYMRDAMRCGDLALFYHSNCATPGVVGIAEVTREAHPDLTALDPKSDYYDPKATPDNPRWCMVALTHVQTFPRTVSLAEIREDPALEQMLVARKGNRLSITPVEEAEFKYICRLAGTPQG